MSEPTLIQKIEALLFYEGGSATLKQLMSATGSSAEDVATAVTALKERTDGTGLVCIVTESEVSLRVAPVCSEFIEKMHKESLAKEIGPAALEVLGILLYRGKSTQADIDTIRGVNSSFSLRTLRMRGLIARTQEGTAIQYSISPDALAHLGITSTEELPQRETILQSLAQFEQRATKESDTSSEIEEE